MTRRANKMVGFLVSAIALGVVFLYGCVGEIITEKAGHLNLGIPGIMCLGTAGGSVGVALYMNGLSNPDSGVWILVILISFIFAVLFSAMGGLIYAFLTVTLKANQNVTGLALTTFGAGFVDYVMSAIDKSRFSRASVLFKLSISKSQNWFCQLFLSYGIYVYIAIAIALAAAFVLRKTKVGLYLRAVGENPATADAAGINVAGYKYCAILIGSAIAGLGGLFYLMDYVSGSWENSNTIQAMGWLAIALVIFTLWRPDLSIIGSIVFGALYLEATKLRTILYLLDAIPYLITILVLILTSVFDSKENQPPASLGLPYFREER